MSDKHSDKPSIKLVGEDGNIFAILGRASTALRKSDRAEQTKEMSQRVFNCHSYDDALSIISEYVDTELSVKKKAPPAKGGDAR